MSAVPVKSLSVSLNRNCAPVAWESFAGAPISISGTLLGGMDFTGIVAICAELHATQDSSETPLAVSDDLESLPAGQSVTLTFTSAKTNRLPGKYFVSIYAVYPDSRLEVFRVCELRLIEGAASQLTPPSPAPALYATTDYVDANWIDWDDWTGEDDPNGRRGAETYDLGNNVFWKKVSLSPHLWVELTGGSAPSPHQVTEGGQAVTEGGQAVTEGGS